jgi:hypothetical protein
VTRRCEECGEEYGLPDGASTGGHKVFVCPVTLAKGRRLEERSFTRMRDALRDIAFQQEMLAHHSSMIMNGHPVVMFRSEGMRELSQRIYKLLSDIEKERGV